jgi:RNA polymerase sigma-70 factor (ECF subfamily)
MVTSILPVSLPDSTPIPAFPSKRLAAPDKFCVDDLLAQAQAGDHDAFSQLYRKFRARVFSICMRMVHDFELAEDLTQETFLQLHCKITSFRGDSLFTTWLHRMTINMVLMRLRKRVLPVISLDHMMMSVTSEEKIERDFGTCDQVQVGVVDRLAIDRALANLPPGCRNIYVLYEIQGFQHKEIATMQGCSLGNSKSQLHRARIGLRSALSAQSDRKLSD